MRTLRNACAALCLIGSLGLSGAASAVETVVLVPDDRASWRPKNLFGFLRPGHNFGERSIRVETTPEGATVDLFYIRSNFQKRYEQAEAPVKVVLPPRSQAGPRDAVTIRAFLEGYKQKEVSIRVSSKQDKVLLELAPLPNTLVAASHVYLAGRASLSFLTKESLEVRVQKRERGFGVILAETAQAPGVAETLSGVRSPLVDEIESLQLGEDLLVQVESTREAQGRFELRSRQSRDDLRDLYVYSVEMIPSDQGVAAVASARDALARLAPSAVSGCALDFDDTLRDGLEPAALSRALAARGSFTDPYLRAAMKRLGELSPDKRIAMLDGSRFNGASSIELAAAMSQPADARGFLALLRAFVDQLESPPHRHETLRGLVAPEVPVDDFEELVLRAESSERSCRAGAATPGA